MKSHKRDKFERAYNNGYKSGIKGHADVECPYQSSHHCRGEWFGGWRTGRRHYLNGYIS